MKNTTTVTAAGVNFTVMAVLSAYGVKFPFATQKDNTRHNEYKVTVKGPAGRATFKFYDSHQAWQNGSEELEDLKHALYCFVSDACSAENDFDNFCGEMGYDSDSRTAERIYKACEKSNKQFKRIAPHADIYEVVNALND